MNRDDYILGTRRVCANARNQTAEFRRSGVANGVRDIERRGASLDRDLQYLV